MENIFSSGPNLKIEIGWNGSHFKNGRLLDFYKIFQKVIAIDKLLTWNLVKKIFYKNITDIEWRPSWTITNVYIWFKSYFFSWNMIRCTFILIRWVTCCYPWASFVTTTLLLMVTFVILLILYIKHTLLSTVFYV